jgi:hypothetical protein
MICNSFFIALTQSPSQRFDINIQLLRKDLFSCTKKTATMPPNVSNNVASKKYDEILNIRSIGDYALCVVETEGILRITRPYDAK